MKLLRNNVLIERTKEIDKTAFGLILPSLQDKAKSDTGTVLFTGPDVQEVKVGDKVVFKKWQGEDIEFEDKKCTMLEEDAIIALIE